MSLIQVWHEQTYAFSWLVANYTLTTSPSVLVTLTSEFGKIISALHQVQIAGSSNLSTGVQIAQVCLLQKNDHYMSRTRLI